jgi:hypothetical protein
MVLSCEPRTPTAEVEVRPSEAPVDAWVAGERKTRFLARNLHERCASISDAPVAQLDRAPPPKGGGLTFGSSRVRRPGDVRAVAIAAWRCWGIATEATLEGMVSEQCKLGPSNEPKTAY